MALAFLFAHISQLTMSWCQGPEARSLTHLWTFPPVDFLPGTLFFLLIPSPSHFPGLTSELSELIWRNIPQPPSALPKAELLSLGVLFLNPLPPHPTTLPHVPTPRPDCAVVCVCCLVCPCSPHSCPHLSLCCGFRHGSSCIILFTLVGPASPVIPGTRLGLIEFQSLLAAGDRQHG